MMHPRQNRQADRLIRSILGIVVVTLLANCGKTEVNAPAIRPALTYKVTAADAANSANLEVYSGEIRARYEADHAFRIGGKIVKRLVDAGATVKRGQALALLDPQDINLAAAAAVAQVGAQQTEADFAEAELKRFRDLFSKGFVSQSALDQKINVANAARARLDSQKATANVARNQAGYATLTAEMDGVVTMVAAEAGQVVSAGQVVMKIANPRDKELVIAVPEAKIAAFRAAAKAADNKNNNLARAAVRVHLSSQPEKFYAANVREIAGAADPITRTYIARISIDAVGEEIGLGMSAFAAFAGANTAGLFSIPLAALNTNANQLAEANVWIVGADGNVKRTPVNVVQYRETTALIDPARGALKLGDTIVAAGVHKLREGEIVRPIIDNEIKGEAKIGGVARGNEAPAATNPATPQTVK